MANRIVVMNRGVIEQVGPGKAIYATPATRFVADFIGEANLLPGTAEGEGGVRLSVGAALLPHRDAVQGADARRRYTGVLRPEHVELLDRPDAPGLITDQGFVEDVIDTGGQTVVTVRVGEQLLSSRRLGMAGEGLGQGTPVFVGFRPQHVHIIAEPTAPSP